jgi:hypothetical protein
MKHVITVELIIVPQRNFRGHHVPFLNILRIAAGKNLNFWKNNYHAAFQDSTLIDGGVAVTWTADTPPVCSRIVGRRKLKKRMKL